MARRADPGRRPGHRRHRAREPGARRLRRGRRAAARTLASSMGVALENARLFDETKRLLTETDERAAELAVINEIGTALAEQLDFQAIIELVGERIAEIFDATSLSSPCTTDDGPDQRSRTSSTSGVRCRRCAVPVRRGPDLDGRSGPTRALASDRTLEDQATAGAIRSADPERVVARRADPGGRPGHRRDRRSRTSTEHAFSEADERLLTTLAASMGVALENARLFDETKRLLTETERAGGRAGPDQRASSSGLAEKLDIQAMYDLVGDKIQEIFDAQVVDIGDLRPGRGLIALPVHDRARRPVPGRADRRSAGLAGAASSRPGPLLINGTLERVARPTAASPDGRPGRAGKSPWLFVPLVVGERGPRRDLAPEPRPRGRVQRGRRPAPDDARGEPERRAGERPPVRRDQAAPRRDERAGRRAGADQRRPARPRRRSSTCRRCTTWSATGSRRSSTPRSSTSGVVDAETDSVHFPYAIERGVRFPDEPMPIIGLAQARHRDPRAAAHQSRTSWPRWRARAGAGHDLGRAAEVGGLFVPLIVGGEVRGVISLQNLDREDAFSESDVGS